MDGPGLVGPGPTGPTEDRPVGPGMESRKVSRSSVGLEVVLNNLGRSSGPTERDRRGPNM